MPESGSKSRHVNNGKGVQSTNPNQSAWLTHWSGTRFESNTHDHLTQLSRSESDGHDIKKHMSGVEIASDNFGYSKGIRDVDLTMSLKKPGSQSFPFFKRGQEQGETRGVLGPQVSHEKLISGLNVETSSRECHLQPEVKYHMFFGESSYSCSRPSDQGAYKLDSHTSHGPDNFRHLAAAFATKEHLQRSEKSEIPSFLRQNNAAFLKTDPSTSCHRSPAFIEEQYKRMQKHIGMGFFPHQTGSPQNTKSQTVHHGSCSCQSVPHFVHDVEMTRMCAPLSTVEGLPGGVHSLLITKQTAVKVYQESQIYRESRVSTQRKGEALRGLNYIPSHFSQGQRGVQLQLLDSSDHESQENVQKNESSADTDAMNMESFKDNPLSGVHLFPPNKDIVVGSNLPLLPPITLSTETDRRRKHKIELPDINLEVCALPAASSSAEKAEPCTSRTQSLDMNALHFNLDHTSNSNSNECSNTNLGSEPGSRWIKRLKLTASNSLENSKMAEPSSHGKLKPALDKRRGKESESLMGEYHRKGSEIQIGECSVKDQQPSKGESSSVETKRERKDITLSHSWIQRWSHYQNQKNPETVETCKPEDSKFATEEFQKKQFPSFAAMALMGKAMAGFQQCKVQKKESFVVWNTKAFE